MSRHEDKGPTYILATNLQALMEQEKMTEAVAAKRAGVSQKAINKILNRSSAATLTTVEKLATAFGLEPWQLLAPLDAATLNVDARAVARQFLAAAPQGRELIAQLAKRESELAAADHG